MALAPTGSFKAPTSIGSECLRTCSLTNDCWRGSPSCTDGVDVVTAVAVCPEPSKFRVEGDSTEEEEDAEDGGEETEEDGGDETDAEEDGAGAGEEEGSVFSCKEGSNLAARPRKRGEVISGMMVAG